MRAIVLAMGSEDASLFQRTPPVRQVFFMEPQLELPRMSEIFTLSPNVQKKQEAHLGFWVILCLGQLLANLGRIETPWDTCISRRRDDGAVVG